jgi:hypothetical protein
MSSLYSSVAIRLVSIVAAIAIAVFFPHQTALLVFFALALAHTMMAFLYQRDAGKWNFTKLVITLISFTVLAILCNTWFESFFVVTGIAFALHMMWDEAHLLGKTPSLMRTLEFVPFLALYSAVLFKAAFNSVLFPYAYIVAAATLVVYAIISYNTHTRPDIVSYVYGAWTLLALASCLFVARFGIVVAPGLWFFGLATMHFLIWYGEYYRRVAKDAARRTRYLSRTLITNGIAGTLAFLFSINAAPVLTLFFGVGFVNAWSLVHIFSSIRVSTLKSWVAVHG